MHPFLWDQTPYGGMNFFTPMRKAPQELATPTGPSTFEPATFCLGFTEREERQKGFTPLGALPLKGPFLTVLRLWGAVGSG